MTPQEDRQEQKQIDLDAANARLAAMKLKESQQGPGDPAAENSAHKAPRRPAVKGVCVNCGKNWSRHRYDGVRNVAYCHRSDDDLWFNTEHTPQPPTQVAGALSKEQAQRLEELILARDEARTEWDSAVTFAEAKDRAFAQASENLDDYIDSLTAQ